jgi:spectinomycin phosphotransferase
MLEKPDLQDERLISSLLNEYALHISELTFLPLGADRHTAVYRAVSEDATPYFVKLRRGAFEETSVVLPKFLSDQGLAHIIAPLATQAATLWANLESFRLTLYPFIDGQSGYEVDLSDRQWRDLGGALRRLHETAPPPTLSSRIQRETYSEQWREAVKTLLEDLGDHNHPDPVTGELLAFLKARRNEILDLVGRAERLAFELNAQPPESVLCHSDIHAGNALVGRNSALYIIDWDTPLFAPKERDLMFIGAGLWGDWRTPQEEERLFYRGYGQTNVDPVALAYYRYERIVQDIAVFCERILSAEEGREDREQSLYYLRSNFRPHSTIAIACASDRIRREG